MWPLWIPSSLCMMFWTFLEHTTNTLARLALQCEPSAQFAHNLFPDAPLSSGIFKCRQHIKKTGSMVLIFFFFQENRSHWTGGTESLNSLTMCKSFCDKTTPTVKKRKKKKSSAERNISFYLCEIKPSSAMQAQQCDYECYRLCTLTRKCAKTVFSLWIVKLHLTNLLNKHAVSNVHITQMRHSVQQRGTRKKKKMSTPKNPWLTPDTIVV